MKKNMIYKLRLNDESARKLAYVSKSEGMTVQNMLSQLIRQKVQYFERVKGNISREQLAGADISQFEAEENI